MYQTQFVSKSEIILLDNASEELHLLSEILKHFKMKIERFFIGWCFGNLRKIFDIR